VYAYRTEWIILEGRMNEAHDMLAAETERVKQTRGEDVVVRIYTPSYSPNVLVFELARESEKANRKFWAEYNESPEGQAFWEKWSAVAKRSLGTERWFVTEFR
jgi:hypothetical protein